MTTERRKSQTIISPRAILHNPPHKRTQKDIEILMKATSGIKFFQEITEREQSNKVHLACCKVLTYAEYEADEYIFRKGDPGDCLYFILKGQVRILLPKDRKKPVRNESEKKLIDAQRKSVLDNPRRSQLDIPRKSQLDIIPFRPRAVTTRNINKEPNSPVTPNKIKDRKDSIDILNVVSTEESEVDDGLIEIARIGAGQSFGEMALINDKPRNATVQCLEKTVLAKLSKEDYQIAGSVHEKTMNEKIDLLRSLPQFANWTKVSLFKLCYYFRTINFKRGQVVYKEDGPVNEVYIIKEGEFKYTKKYQLPLSNAFNPYDLPISSSRSNNSFNKLRKQNHLFRTKELQIVIKQKGQMFGFEEILQHKNTREYTCTCISNDGELFVISEKDFSKRVAHPETMKYLEESNEIFKTWADRRIDELHDLEGFKDGMAFTPNNKIRPDSESPKRSYTPRVAYKPYEVYISPAKPLPKIFYQRSPKPAADISFDSPLKYHKKNLDYDPGDSSYYTMFETEVPEDISISPYKTPNNKFRSTYMADDQSITKSFHKPIRLLPATRSRKRKQDENIANKSFM
ncbi:unnamed protein product [Blepharisma stoltei]|uniref:Cyclic nucleotide-binding domain-containing protein n=1 Tax=Blepharisma stoltei TaxID=1481888 RepID=A0AAU9JJC7_9CILI|nr:unnamed protein product [Blepharisma stoltei]